MKQPLLEPLRRWWYAGLGPELRAEARHLDRCLLQRQGLGLWLGLLGAAAGGTLGLVAAGLPLHWALLAALLFVCGGAVAMRRAWLQPEKFDTRTLRRIGGLMIVATYAGALGGALDRKSVV